MSNEKPDEKPGASGPLRPPHPPPGVKKPGTPLPKGPVPPRGGMQLPGMKPITPAPAAKPPMPPNAGTPTPAKPPAMPPGMAPKPPSPMPPPMTGASGTPPPMPPAGGGPVPPALTQKLAQADGSKADLEQKIADLEKKLLEEREKVLLASLRTKEEEAVSAKVETSIKEIQDKLRREKREQELDDSRRKSEARSLELERRMAEEREAWVATLKSQLSQRDQVTQEMETHFSVRLKDLEYRWSQEKSVLENALREREGELARLRQEMQLKSEQEKAFWEDRVKSITADRDRIDREFERAKDKFSQEKDHLMMERQSLRDQLGTVENKLKIVEEHHHTDKAALQREMEATITMLRHQLSVEKDAALQQINTLGAQHQHLIRENTEKNAHANALEHQLSALRAQINQYEFRMTEKDKLLEEARRRATDVTGVTDEQRKKYEVEIDRLMAELNKARYSSKEEVQRVQNEADARIRTLQTRLDWYDSNVKREYDNARAQVQEDVQRYQTQLKEAEKIIEELKASQSDTGQSEEKRLALEQELQQLKTEWRQSQWEAETHAKEINEQLKSAQTRLEQGEETRIALEQELKQRISNANYLQSQIEQRELDARKLQDALDNLKKEAELYREKDKSMQTQVEEYKQMLHGKGLRASDDLQAQIDQKTKEMEQARETISGLKLQLQEADKKDDLFKEREKNLKQLAVDKEEMMNEFKNRLMTVDRKLQQVQAELDESRQKSKQEKDVLSDQHKAEIVRLQSEAGRQMQQVQSEIEKAKRLAAEEMAEKIRAELPPPGPNPQMLQAQIRQDMESEFMDRMRQREDDFETKLAQAKEETKKEMDKLKWENESMKEEVRRAREARVQIEREAQELLQQAESHYQRQIEKHQADVEQANKKPKGLFTSIGTTLGRLLDTPIVDTHKKKDGDKNDKDDLSQAA